MSLRIVVLNPKGGSGKTTVATNLLAAYAKYVPTHGYQAEVSNWAAGIWRVRPRKVLGWSSFPADTTRWTFER